LGTAPERLAARRVPLTVCPLALAACRTRYGKSITSNSDVMDFSSYRLHRRVPRGAIRTGTMNIA
jgi:hypothetical protein